VVQNSISWIFGVYDSEHILEADELSVWLTRTETTSPFIGVGLKIWFSFISIPYVLSCLIHSITKISLGRLKQEVHYEVVILLSNLMSTSHLSQNRQMISAHLSAHFMSIIGKWPIAYFFHSSRKSSHSSSFRVMSIAAIPIEHWSKWRQFMSNRQNVTYSSILKKIDSKL